jgi:tripartite-type tricarboxylate transporter receptor subunit TctC
LIIPFPAGGSTDALLRPLASAASKHLGQPIVIENRPGATGTLGVTTMVQSKPDGYTLAQIPITVFTAAHMGDLRFDPRKDITYIIHLTGFTFGLVVRSDTPWKTVEDFLAHARAHPGEVTYASSGPASSGHLSMERLAELARVKLLHVPFKGMAEGLTALLGGHVHALATSSGWAAQVESGKLRLLATFSPTRTQRWPSVPTMKELGYDVVITSPYGIGGPRAMDPRVVERIHSAFKKALQDPATAAAMVRLDQVVDYKGPAAYTTFAQQLYLEQGTLVKRFVSQGQ